MMWDSDWSVEVLYSGLWQSLIFFFKQKTAYEITRWLEFRRVLFRFSFDHFKLKGPDLCLHWRALVILETINMYKLIPIIDQLLDKKILLIYFYTFQVLLYITATSTPTLTKDFDLPCRKAQANRRSEYKLSFWFCSWYRFGCFRLRHISALWRWARILGGRYASRKNLLQSQDWQEEW